MLLILMGRPRVTEVGARVGLGLCGLLLAVSCHLRPLEKLRCAVDGRWAVLG